MQNAKRSLKSSLVGAALVALAMNANAGFLGNTVEGTYRFSTFGTILDTVVAVIDGSEEYTFFGPSDARHWNLGDTTILTRFDNTGGNLFFTAGAFNGVSFFDVFATIDPIINVTIDPSTNLPGFDASRISFDADRVNINYQGLAIDDEFTVLLHVEFARQVPLPATAALLALGLGGLAWRRRKA